MAEEALAAAPATATTTCHVVMFPFPIQGHMPPMLNLATLLSSSSSSSSDFLLTFVNTHHSHRSFSRHSSTLRNLDGGPNFRFRTIPDGLPDDNPRQSKNFLELEQSLMGRQSWEAFKDLLVGRDPDGWPRVTCVIVDAVFCMPMEVAQEAGIPWMIFRTGGACSFWAFKSVQQLFRTGDLPFPENADMDELVRGVKGTETFLRRRDLPGFCRDAKSPNDPIMQLVAKVTSNASRGRAFIINTFEALEHPMLSNLRSFCPVVYPIGPLHIFAKDRHSVNLWQQDRSCMEWLESQPPRSVVYVSFGSLIVMSKAVMTEIWHGLVNSNRRFLWVIRKDLLLEEPETTKQAPVDEPLLEEGTRERGCLVNWAPQEEVLAHPAVGCFLTHSGWNSTIESMTAGVPMICCPFATDQQINSRFVSEVWKIGLDMKDRNERSTVEKMVRDAMEGDQAEELRRSARETADKARASVEEGGGSSYKNLQSLVQHIRSFSSEQ